MPDDRYEIRLENVFEGPMDLLVYLIRKNEIDIYNIPIARITEEYLRHLEWIRALNVDHAGDFLLMASTLTHIKSAMLLPRHETGDEAEDPRLAVVRPLAEYLRIRAAAEKLDERPLLNRDIFPRTSEETPATEEAAVEIGIYAFFDAVRRLLTDRGVRPEVDLSADPYTVRGKMTEIEHRLRTTRTLSFAQLFDEDASKPEVIAVFLAVLELAKTARIRILQFVADGSIRIVRRRRQPAPEGEHR